MKLIIQAQKRNVRIRGITQQLRARSKIVLNRVVVTKNYVFVVGKKTALEIKEIAPNRVRGIVWLISFSMPLTNTLCICQTMDCCMNKSSCPKQGSGVARSNLLYQGLCVRSVVPLKASSSEINDNSGRTPISHVPLHSSSLLQPAVPE